ncbi:aminotransferase class I/II-fold pyridoxal phosphate-dependent enzyme [Streptomyces sp. NPDC029004]|uniref:aminotransferase class I/II-fold pyridoxal phosphate-dependent enzyme n=1 Tax=Streptomyces sp. NPDC029004 TaxID=3154490 RepID=UPI0033CBBFCA
MAFDPQLQTLYDRRSEQGVRPLYTMSLDEARAADLAAIQADGGTPEPVEQVLDESVPGPAGSLPVRIYRPAGEGPLPVLVYFFGGGWTLGSIATSDAICRSLANAAGCLTIAVGYRLAPEHKFPAAPQDCLAGVRWAAEHAVRFGGDATRLAVGGDSAGGNLAAAVTLMARDAGGPEVLAQLLVYPNTDYLADTPSRRENTDPLLFNDKSVQWYWDNYLASPQDGTDPLASPLRASDHSGLPPALVITAEYDPLRDEGEQYAQRLRDHGVPVESTRYPGVAHGFFAMAGTLDAGRRAIEQAAAYLRKTLATPMTGAPAAPVPGGVFWIRPDQGAGSGACDRKAEEGADAERRRLTTTQRACAPGHASPARSERHPLDVGELHGSLSDPVLDAMNFLNEVVSRFPEAISFAPGRPSEGTFEPDDLARYLRAYTDHLEHGLGWSPDQVRTQLFQYGRTNGIIHDLIARSLANDEGIHIRPESVVVTTGCQEAMLLTLRALFARPEDTLLVSSPCYVGITGAARLLEVAMRSVPEGEAGPDPDAVLAAVCETRAAGGRPRALYVVPDFANPSGASMSVAARERLLEIAAQEDLLILEDDPYGFFVRAGSARPTLKALDRDRRVIHLGSFSKTALPGARVGYVIADQEVIGPTGERSLLADQLSKIKSMTTVNTSAVSQAVIGGLLIESDCRLRAANADAIAFYRTNLDTLLGELERHFPAERRRDLGIDWNQPDGGFFLVVNVPFVADAKALEHSAQNYGVLWTPMSSFYLDGGGDTQLRLSCSALDPDGIAEGVSRLAAFIADQAEQAALAGE